MLESLSHGFFSYFSQLFVAKLLPAFHENDRVNVQLGRGAYCLYQGNLSVPENEQAVFYLLKNIFSKIDVPVKIAGAEPSEELKSAIAPYNHIELIENPTANEMQVLMQAAHIHILYAQDRSGMKLKLLNSLFQGRFVIANKSILLNSNLVAVATLAETPAEFIAQINAIWPQDFTDAHVAQRQRLLENYFYNKKNSAELLETIFD